MHCKIFILVVAIFSQISTSQRNNLGCRFPDFYHGGASCNMSPSPIHKLYYPVGTVCAFSCWRNLNVVLDGSRTITCQSSGHWHPEPPRCVIDEPQLCKTITLGNGLLWYSNPYANGGYAVGTKAMFSFKEGYKPYGQTRTCVIDSFLFARWRPNSFGCIKAPPPCYPLMAKVKIENGKSIQMSELQTGDRVQAVASDGSIMYSDVRSFMKRRHNVNDNYRSITTSSRENIRISGNHLIYMWKNYTQNFKMIYPAQVSIGDEVLSEGNRSNKLTPAKVTNVSNFMMQGAFTPLTMQGSIVVDGVLASCYAFPDHDLAHMAMIPIRWYPEVMEWLFGIEDGFTGFAKIAENLGNYVLPHDSLY